MSNNHNRRSFFKRFAAFAAIVAIAPQIAFGRRLEIVAQENDFDWEVEDVSWLKFDLGSLAKTKIHSYAMNMEASNG